MKIGVVFPQTEIGPETAPVKEYALAAEEAGYEHLLVYDHVLGAGLDNRPDFRGPYSSETQFREVFVLFGYLAAITEKLELVTGVVILPQRQTALVAKQAAEIDLLSEGRLRLGVGIGWNDVEYTGLNENFGNRGRRSEEQIEVLRKLFTERVVNFGGKYHHIPEAGINPLPVQRPIPIWIGGTADPALERAGRLADGWFPQVQPGERLEHMKSVVAEGARNADRDPESIGLEGRISIANADPSEWKAMTDAWRETGATHLSVNTMGTTMDAAGHIDMIRRYREAIG
ncbi:MAG: LLM class F420-dependent oxidoreductase [Chloroflexia bacterium]|nr:LLM class F420-dependent oxidoreductase [Chloroflexia bacterium]